MNLPESCMERALLENTDAAFWKLTDEKQDAYFIAATGAGNVEALANMFLGWGLEFIVAVDDDTAGRQAYNALKRHLFGDQDAVDCRN